VFYRRAIAALCLMILFPARYFNEGDAEEQEWHDKASEMYKRVSREVANFVIAHYLHISKEEKKEISENMLVNYLYDGNTDYTDPGPPFTLGNTLTKETQRIHARKDNKRKVSKK
jgi:hypothetical protein